MEPNSLPPQSLPQLPPQHPGSTDRPRFRPGLFFGMLLAPAILTTISVLVVGTATAMAPAVFIAMIGSLAGGIFCGVHFAHCQSTLTPGGKVGVGIVMAIGCCAGAFALSFGGCLAGAAVSEALRGPF